MFYIEPIQERSIGIVNYIELSDGRNISETLDAMTTTSTNTTNSPIKDIIDTWYGENMTSYTSYLEDTIWCNDRTIGEIAGWDKDGNASTKQLVFLSMKNLKNGTISLTCQNKNDAFTVDDIENGNGKLTYPVAILTAPELTYAGAVMYNSTTDIYLLGTNAWATLTPNIYDAVSYKASGLHTSGWYGNYDGHAIGGVHPSVSLKPNTRSIDGDGSPEDPFVVE